MAIAVGLCDDNPMQIEVLEGYLRDCAWAGRLDVYSSTDPAGFLEMVRDKRPEVVFLDIDMGETSGIQLGEAIKALDAGVVLIYVTAHEKYALEAFGVRAFHYLLKPLTKEAFDRALGEGLRHLEKSAVKEEPTFTLRTKKEVACLRYEEILYFEKVGHKIRIRAGERDYFYYGNFKGLLVQLDAGFFVQCHQGYIANVAKIRGFRDKTLFLGKGISLPVSRSYCDAVKNVLAERLFE